MRGLRTIVVLTPLACASWLHADPPWEPPTVLDSRLPLELPPPLVDAATGFAFAPVLFDQATNSLELARLDLNVHPPLATFAPVATGNLFALGGVGRVGNQLGFSFVDGNFDLRFATCTLPCGTVSTFPIDTAQVWLDSQTGASGDRFFVAGLDNNANHTVTVFTSPGGGSWTPLSTFTPPDPGGVYASFFGGKRIGLAVDPTATNPGTTRNCLLYESCPPPGTVTNLRVLCRDGAAFVFNTLVDADAPNPQGQFDRFIETSVGMGPPPDRQIFGAYSSRTRQEMAAFLLAASGPVAGQGDIGSVPTGDAFFSFIVSLLEESGELEVLHPAGPGLPARYVRFDPATGSSFPTLGPPIEPGPVTMFLSAPPADPGDAFMWALGRVGLDRGRAESEAPLGGGLAASRRKRPLFDDGFEVGSTVRWSSAAP